jgi:PKD repeat protein
MRTQPQRPSDDADFRPAARRPLPGETRRAGTLGLGLGLSVRRSGGGAAPLVANFTGTPLSGNASLSVVFTDASTGGPSSWLWEKNSGSGWVNFAGTPTAQNPTESFAVGTWSVRLTATNAGGSNTKTRTNYVSSAWNPSLITPALWLEASTTYCFTDAGGTVACADGDPVRVWKDRSGNSRDLSQGTLGNRPLYRANSGNPYVEFDGTDDFMSAAYSPGALAGATMLASARLTANGSFPVIFTQRPGETEFRGNAASRQISVTTSNGGGNVTDPSALATTTDYTIGFVTTYGAASGCSVYRDGTAVATGTDNSTTSATPTTLNISGRSAGSLPWVGRIYGLVFCPAAISGANVTLLHTYLAALHP